MRSFPTQKPSLRTLAIDGSRIRNTTCKVSVWSYSRRPSVHIIIIIFLLVAFYIHL